MSYGIRAINMDINEMRTFISVVSRFSQKQLLTVALIESQKASDVPSAKIAESSSLHK